MKLSAIDPFKPITVDFGKMQSTLKNLRDEHGVQSYIGTLTTTKGILILLFSPQLNRDVSLLVEGGELSKVLTRVFEVLGEI